MTYLFQCHNVDWKQWDSLQIGKIVKFRKDKGYLNTHCRHFMCNDFPEIVTLNMMEMKRDNARFFRYYLTGKFDKGYLVYNREMKPMISLE